MGKDGLHDLLGIVLVLVPELQDHLLVLQAAAGEQALDVCILRQQVRDDVQLADLLPVGVHVQNLGERREGGPECVGVGLGGNVLVQELLEHL